MATKHAIMIIRNQKGDYLQYYDKRWNSYLFLNSKIDDDFKDSSIETILQEKLDGLKKINSIQFLGDKLHRKYSVSADCEKEYHHYFYLVKIDLLEYMKQEEFECHQISYKWFGMKELQKDVRIQEVNRDIIEYVGEFMNKL